MAAKKKVVAKKVVKKTAKAKAPKKMNFKQAQKRALALLADWYSRNEAGVEKFLERLEKMLVEFNSEPKERWTPVPLPFPAVGDAVYPVGMMGQAAPVSEEPKPEVAVAPAAAMPPITFP